MKKLFLLLAMLAPLAFAQSLVSEQEMRDSMNAPAQPRPKFVPEKDAPKIVVLAPNLAGTLSSPTPIQVNFEAANPASVKPDSFKVLYGAFQIDITQRMLSAAKLTSTGISAPSVTLPAGTHKLHVYVEDTAGRKGYRLVEFTIN